MKLSEIFLIEARQAYLYHWMSVGKTQNVFANDLMPARWQHNIPGISKPVVGNSFSRNSSLRYNKNPIKITVDQIKLTHTNKIIPADGYVIYRKGDDHAHRELCEEFVVGPIKNIHNCIVQIECEKKYEYLVSEYAKQWNISVQYS